MELKNFKVGLRTWKTVVAVAITASVMTYIFQETPFFGCIGASVAIGRSGKESLRNALIRNVGTLVGGTIGILMLFISDNILINALGVIPVITVICALKLEDSVIPGCIVYFAVVYLMAVTGEGHIYAVRRIFHTFVGTLIGVAVNMLLQPPPFHHHHEKAQPTEKKNDTLMS
ncbi:MAG: aromatic acid exporter family protein [Peptostreptococcaceae bacterium]|nr:aromatic acid exporter family protein [Peptostreptococcaceae bacterium]